MIESTRELLRAIRDEIAGEIEPVSSELAQLRVQLADAEAHERCEGARVADLNETIAAFPARGDLANSLRTRLIAAAKPAAFGLSVRAIVDRVVELEAALADRRSAVAQVDALLRPTPVPALSLVPAEPASRLAPFETIVMPATRVA